MKKKYRILLEEELAPNSASFESVPTSVNSTNPSTIGLPAVAAQSPPLSEVGSARSLRLPTLPDPASTWQREQPIARPGGYSSESTPALDKAEVIELIRGEIAQLKVYVVESEITAAQNSVKSVVELASF